MVLLSTRKFPLTFAIQVLINCQDGLGKIMVFVHDGKTNKNIFTVDTVAIEAGTL